MGVILTTTCCFYGLFLMSLMEICSFVKEVYISAKGEVSSTWSCQYKAVTYKE